jgi:FixJ family two-component response regulator
MHLKLWGRCQKNDNQKIQEGVMSSSNNMLSDKQYIYVVEDDDAVRDSLSLLLTSEGYPVKTFTDGDSFLSSFDEGMSGCVILDIRMPGLDGMAVQQLLISKKSTIPVIFVTGHGDVALAVEAMKLGAMDFIQKPYDETEILEKVAAAFSQDLAHREMLNAHGLIKQNLDTLTPREKEVMEMMVSGHANKVIAIDLNISQRTVEIHRSRVMHKMGTNSLAHLVKMVLALND